MDLPANYVPRSSTSMKYSSRVHQSELWEQKCFSIPGCGVPPAQKIFYYNHPTLLNEPTMQEFNIVSPLVELVHAESPWDIYVRTPALVDHRKAILAKMEKAPKRRNSTTEIGAMYLVRCNKSFERVYVLNVHLYTVQVRYVDLGYEEEITYGSLYTLPREMWTMPSSVLKCCLYDCKFELKVTNNNQRFKQLFAKLQRKYAQTTRMVTMPGVDQHEMFVDFIFYERDSDKFTTMRQCLYYNAICTELPLENTDPYYHSATTFAKAVRKEHDRLVMNSLYKLPTYVLLGQQECTVVRICSLDEFYVLPTALLSERESLINAMQELYDSSEKTVCNRPLPGKLCAFLTHKVEAPKVGTKWYRGIVLRMQYDGVLMYALDFGWTGIIKRDAISVLDLTYSNFTVACLRCKLTRLARPEDKPLSDVCLETFRSYCDTKPTIMLRGIRSTFLINFVSFECEQPLMEALEKEGCKPVCT